MPRHLLARRSMAVLLASLAVAIAAQALTAEPALARRVHVNTKKSARKTAKKTAKKTTTTLRTTPAPTAGAAAPAPAPPAPASTAPAPKPVQTALTAGYVDASVTLTSPLPDSKAPIPVTVRVPPGWKRTPGTAVADIVHFQLDPSDDVPVPTLEVSASCGGECNPIPVDNAIAAMVGNKVRESFEHPEVMIGKQTVVGTSNVSVLGQGSLAAGGAWVAIEAPTPDPTRPYPDVLVGHCYVHRAGERFYILTNVFANRSRRAQFDALLEACKLTR